VSNPHPARITLAAYLFQNFSSIPLLLLSP
jgi:hypothetical protein